MTTAIVLAAGAGTRLGVTKGLADVGGRSALREVLQTCHAAALDDVVVVTGADAEAVEQELLGLGTTADVATRSVRNDAWRAGRTGSVQAGWASAAEASAVLVFPVDHPAVSVVTLDLLLGVYGYAGGQPEVVVPAFGPEGARRRGHPVLLGPALRETVLALPPDEPLHSVVRGRTALEVPVDDEGILLNVDSPDDLRRARELLAARHVQAE